MHIVYKIQHIKYTPPYKPMHIAYKIHAPHAVTYRDAPYRTVAYRTVPCRIAPCRIVTCRTMPYRTAPYRTYRTVPHRTVPFRTLRYRAVPSRIVPYLAVPCRTAPQRIHRTVMGRTMMFFFSKRPLLAIITRAPEINLPSRLLHSAYLFKTQGRQNGVQAIRCASRSHLVSTKPVDI